MKKSILARGFVGSVASLLGVLAVGCGADMADEASAGNGEIGVSQQAIVKADVTTLGVSLPVALADHAMCTVKVSGTDYVIAAGGDLGTGAFSDDAYVLKTTATQAWTTFSNVLPDGVVFGKMIQDPNDPASCLFVGGEDVSGNKEAFIRRLTLTVNGSGVPTALASNNAIVSGTMTARSNHEIVQCGDGSKILIAAGEGASGVLTSLETFDSSNGAVAPLKDATTPTAQNVSLNNARKDFAIATADDNRRIMIAGGQLSNLTKVGSVESLLVNDSCVTTTVRTLASVHPDTITARSGLKAFHQAHSGATDRETFFVAVGSTGSAVQTVESVLIDFDDPTNSSASVNDIAASTNAQVAADSPAFAVVGLGQAFLIGGISENDAQEHDLVNGWTTTNQDKVNATLPVREGGQAVYAPTINRVYVTGGFDGSSFLTNVLEIVP